MALRSSGNQYSTIPTKFNPITVCDSYDIGETGEGGMIGLVNLIPDPSTKNYWVPRPASILLTNFPGFTTPGFISGLVVTGNYAVGMIATGRTANHDEPFVYDLVNNVFRVVAGVTASNVPLSPASSGPWVPPILTSINLKVLIAHPGYNGSGNGFFGVIDMSNPNSPVYSSGNTTGTPLPSPPVTIESFSNRAWYACNPTGTMPVVVFSDSNNPLQVTTGTSVQELTLGDWVPITAMGSLQYENQLGGIVQALIIFKGVGNIYQVTGDAALNNLTLNTLNVATGTLSPLSITNTPKGLVFLSPDGFRLIDSNGVVSEPIGTDGSGITMPFMYSAQPSRVIATSNAKIVRGSTLNADPNGPGIRQAPWGGPGTAQEWWYDTSRSAWSGPHTFPCDQIQAWNDTFIVVPIGLSASLYQSDYKPTTASSFMEPLAIIPGNPNPVQMEFFLQFPLVHEEGSMNQYQLVESYLQCSFDANNDNITGAFMDEWGRQLTNAYLVNPPLAYASKWGTAVWGHDPWGSSAQTLTAQRVVMGMQPVFDRASLFLTGKCGTGLRIGAWWARINTLGFLKDATADPAYGSTVP